MARPTAIQRAVSAPANDGAAAEARMRLLEGQNQVLRSIAAGVGLPLVLDQIARQCEAAMPGALCSILLVDEDLCLRHGAAPSLPAAYCSAIDGVKAGSGVGSCGTAVAERRLVIVGDIETHPYWRDFKRLAMEHGLRACWSSCVLDGSNRALGSFAVYYRQPREPQQWELDLIDILRDLAAIAIERHEATQRQSRLIQDLEQQRARAEAAVARFRDSEQRFRDLTAASSDFYWEQDASLRFRFVSDARYSQCGLDSAPLYGRTWREIEPLGLGEEQLRRHEQLLLDRRPFRDLRYHCVAPDGRLRYLSMNGVPVFDEASGAFRGYRGTGRDISHEVQTAETFRAIIDAMPAMINAKDINGRYVLMNAYQARFYGTTPADAVGKNSADLLGQTYGDYTAAIDRRVIESGQSTGFYEETYATADGVDRQWQTAKLPLKDGRGVVQYVISLSMDITALKATEQQLRHSQQALSDAVVGLERSSRAKSNFLASMSHELRTPLNAIIGFSETMAHELMGPIGSPRYKEYAEDIYRSGQYLHDLISDMLDMAKIEAGRREIAWETIDAALEIEETVRMIRPRAAAGEVTVETELNAAPEALLADRRAFRQIVLNIVSNAVKFTPKGGRVTIRLTRAEGGAKLIVRDTGVGIPPSQIERLGTPFFRIEDPRRASTEGSGLGLALTKSLVSLQGWTIGFESTMGEGTTVTVDMPGAT